MAIGGRKDAKDATREDGARKGGPRAPGTASAAGGPAVGDDRSGDGGPIGRVAYPDRTVDGGRGGDDDASAAGEPARVVAGRVGTWDEAERVRQGLLDEGFAPADVEVFYTGPAGRHAVTPIGGDASSDAGATKAGAGAAAGGIAGAAAGLAVGAAVATAPVAVPVLLAAAGVGAYGGALAGGVGATEDGAKQPDSAEHPVAKPAGVVVAVRVDRADGDEARALRCLDAGGAIGLERSPARWESGSWIDFDPVAPREQIAPEPGTPQA